MKLSSRCRLLFSSAAMPMIVRHELKIDVVVHEEAVRRPEPCCRVGASWFEPRLAR
jgi:hypothetical protein